jgi:DNA-directed RNA polymerase specialized sigma24 family protein
MQASDLNSLYSQFLNDPKAGLDPLLEAVREMALIISQDQDIAQSILIEVWRALPTLVIKTSFAAYVNRKARWRKLDFFKGSLINRNIVEVEEADRCFVEPNDEPRDFDQFWNPIFKSIVVLLSEGFKTVEISKKLNMPRESVRSILQNAIKPNQQNLFQYM